MESINECIYLKNKRTPGEQREKYGKIENEASAKQ